MKRAIRKGEVLDERLKQTSFLIVTHTYATGLPQEFEKHMKDKVRLLGFIGHPFPYSVEKRTSFVLCEKGRQVKSLTSIAGRGPDALFYIKDFFYTVYFALKAGTKFDVYLGVNNFNALAGIVLRSLGRVRAVVFVTVDYTPRRFGNPVLNRIYHFCDKISCRGSDLLWNISPIMAREREKRGILQSRCASQFIAPIGNNFDEIRRPPFEKLDRHTVVFMGHLRENQGIEFLIDAMPEVIARVPGARLRILGGGHLEDSLKQRVARLGLDGSVEFRGYIESHSELENLMARGAVGVAPYAPGPQTFTQYTDPSKPKAYMAAGLPIVITKVPQIATEIEERGAGYAIEYNREELVAALTRLLSDDEEYKKRRENVIKLAQEYSWDRIFAKALAEMDAAGLLAK